LENKIKKITKSKYALAVINASTALELSLRAIGVKANDEIILPSLTFVATAFSISHCGAIPHFVDSNEDDLSISILKLEKYLDKILFKKGNFFYNKTTKRRVFAIMPVHIFGIVGKIDKLIILAKKYNLKIIEDAAEALGSYYKNKHAGTFGDIGIVSFNANKTITTGGGGVIITNKKKLFKKLLKISANSKEKHKWKFFHSEIGWNARLPNINAAIGVAQLEKLREILFLKKKIAKYYLKAFTKYQEISFVKAPSGCNSNYWLAAIKINFKSKSQRDDFLNRLNKFHEVRPVWNLLHTLPMYTKNPKSNLETAKKLEKKLITLPSSPEYGKFL
jgi:perosamine synthetase